jgi:hypothetical protein
MSHSTEGLRFMALDLALNERSPRDALTTPDRPMEADSDAVA